MVGKMTYPRPLQRATLIGKNRWKISFCKWIKPVSFNYLPMSLQEQIIQASAYIKKFDFQSFLKLLVSKI